MDEYRREDLAWVAGVFEGEGTIRVRRRNYGAQVSIRMDYEDVIRRIHEIMDFGNFYVLNERRKRKGAEVVAVQYNYQIASAEHVIRFPTAVLPWLSVRRKAVAEEAIASARLIGSNFAHAWTPERRARYADTMARKRASAKRRRHPQLATARCSHRRTAHDPSDRPGRGRAQPGCRRLSSALEFCW
jgi:hypothetical protein